MHDVQTTTSDHARIVNATFQDEHLDVLADLDALENVAHDFARLLIDHFRTDHVLTILSIVRDEVVHVDDATFVHQVDDQLQLMQALKVGHFEHITNFDQHLEAHLHQLDGTTTQHDLFTEQIDFDFFTEVDLDHTTLSTTVGNHVRQGDITDLAELILINDDQRRHATALEVLGTHGMAGTLRNDHDHVQISAEHDLIIMHIETVDEDQHSTLLNVELDVVLVHLKDILVEQQDHDNIDQLHNLINLDHLDADNFDLEPKHATTAQTDHHVDTRITQILRMDVTLRTVTHDDNVLTLDQAQVNVLIVINFH